MPAMTAPSRLAALLSFAVLTLGCNVTPSSPGSAEQQSEPGHSEQGEPGSNSEAAEAVPVIASDEPVFDFGTVSPTGSVTHVFKLVNRGSADLHIERVERT